MPALRCVRSQDQIPPWTVRVFVTKPLRYTALGTVFAPLPQCLRPLSLLYTLRGMVKRVLACRPSNNKRRWWEWKIAADTHRRSWSLSCLSWSEGHQPLHTLFYTFVRWTAWSLVMIVSSCRYFSPQKFALARPVWKQERSAWKFNTTCGMISSCRRLYFLVMSDKCGHSQTWVYCTQKHYSEAVCTQHLRWTELTGVSRARQQWKSSKHDA